MSRFKKRSKDISKRILQFATDPKHRGAVVATSFALVGAIALLVTQAATPTTSYEVERSESLAGCAREISATSASASSAVRFGCNGSGVLSLDNTGRTIPTTNYAIPAGAIYMSPAGSDKKSDSVDGNDANDGSTKDKPVRTISRAIALVSSSRSTIVLRGGEYRDSHSSGSAIIFESKSFTLQAYPSESPWFTGADVVATGWASSGANVWARSWETPDFCGGGQYYLSVEGGKPPFSPNLTSFSTQCAYGDSVKNSTTVAGDPQNVFINDTKLAQVTSLAQVTPNTFFYDWTAKKMYIGQNPTTNKVELSKRTQALMLNQGNYAIKGVGFKRYASGGNGGTSGNWTVANTVFINSPQSALIENSVFADNAYIGLGFSQPKNNGSKIINSVFARNGYAGLHANGSRSSGGRDDFKILSNVFNENNDQNFDIQCGGACGAANVKLNNMVGFTAKDNIVTNAKAGGYGFWCDINCSDGVIVNNLVKNNAKVGIFYEISRDGTIASNVAVDNGQDGIGVTAANTNVYNNTVIFDRAKNPTGRGINIFDDNRCAICWNDPGIGPDTRNIELVNNLVVARSGGELSVSLDSREVYQPYATPTTTTNTKASQFYDKFDYNAYFRTSTGSPFYVWRRDNGTVDFGIKSTAAFTAATGWDGNSLDITGSAIPFFVDITNGDYRLKTDSQPYTNKGQALPAEVAAHLGLATGSVHPRGAINWPR